MKKLFLSSYFPKVSELFQSFFGSSLTGKKAVFIPTASIPETLPFYVGAERRALRKLGFTVEDLDISSVSYEKTEKTVEQSDCIFVSGGNTFFLLQELRRTGADRLICRHIDKGKMYIGSSAGSIILSKDISYAKHMDSPDAAPELNGNFLSLGEIEVCIIPHYRNFPFKRSSQKILNEFSDRFRLIPISNNQAVISDGKKYETVSVKQ